MAAARYDVVFYVPSVTPLLTRRDVAPPGGAETQIFLLTRALARQGARVCLVVFESAGDEIPAAIDGVDIVVRPRYQAHQPLLGKILEAIRIHQSLRAIDAPIVVTRVAGAQVGLVGASAKLRRKRFVYSSANISDFDFGIALSPKRRDLELFRLGIRLANTIVVQTDEQVELCERAFGKSPTLIKSIAEPAPDGQRTPVAFLWIGRLVWYKRPLAFVELAKALPDISFRMVGVPSPGEPELAEEVKSAADGVDNLELLAPRPRSNLMALIDDAVAVVNTADFEGMPNIFLEGWARGIPALALTHDPGGVIENHRIGEFARGSFETLTVAAERLWLERAKSAELSERCRRYVVDNHSADAIAAHWMNALGLAKEIPSPALVQAA